MRKWIVWMLIALLMLSITGCKKQEQGEKQESAKSEAVEGEGNTLFQNASPQTSVMEFYYYDGKKGYLDWTNYGPQMKEILESLSKVTAVPVDSWDFKVTYPMYGMGIGSVDGMGLQMLWTNGYLITRDGDVYTFDFDWKSVLEDVKWSEDSRRDIEHIAAMPNIRYLALKDAEWNRKMMNPAPDIDVVDGIEMSLVRWQRNTVTVNLHSDREEPWMYGRQFRLDVKIKRKWYEVPPTPEKNWMFTSEGILLTSEEDNEESFDIGMFGYLPAGTYRVVLADNDGAGVYLEHTVSDTAEEMWKDSGLEPAEEPVAPEGIQIQLDDWTEEAIEVTIENDSEEEWSFGNFSRLDVLIEGAWYIVPDYQTAHALVGYVVVPGEERSHGYSLEGYGHLPKGTYRFVLEGLSIEHTVG